MASNYEKGFTIEYVKNGTKRVSCKDCIYYDASDRSCLKTARTFSLDSTAAWRKCSFYDLAPFVNEFDKKQLESFQVRGTSAIIKRYKIEGTVHIEKSKDNMKFNEIERKYKYAFKCQLLGRREIELMNLYELIPDDLYERYRAIIMECTDEAFTEALAAFFINIGLEVKSKRLVNIRNKVRKYIGNKVIESEQRITKDDIEKWFIESIAVFLETHGFLNGLFG